MLGVTFSLVGRRVVPPSCKTMRGSCTMLGRQCSSLTWLLVWPLAALLIRAAAYVWGTRYADEELVSLFWRPTVWLLWML